MTHPVIYEKGPNSWGVMSRTSGVISVGDTGEEVERLIEEAIEFHLDGPRDEGLAVPQPASFAGTIEVNPAA